MSTLQVLYHANENASWKIPHWSTRMSTIPPLTLQLLEHATENVSWKIPHWSTRMSTFLPLEKRMSTLPPLERTNEHSSAARARE